MFDRIRRHRRRPVNDRGDGPRHRFDRRVASLSATALAVGLLGSLGFAGTAYADPDVVYELEGEWLDAPAEVETGQVVMSQWWFNLNDEPKDDPIGNPSNGPVENVTLELSATNGVFAEIPEICLTDPNEADPISEIIDDGETLVCNIGDTDLGTAVSLKAAVEVTATEGEDVSLAGQVGDQEVDLDPLEVWNELFMDIAWESNTGIQTITSDGREFEFNWTLFHGRHSPAGPSTIEYDVELDYEGAASTTGLGCSAFEEGTASGHPWSGGNHDAHQVTNHPDCSFVHQDGNTWKLTLSNIDYSHDQIPTHDSTGSALSTDPVAIGSGIIKIRLNDAESRGSIGIDVSTPTYEASDGTDRSYEDDASNNQSRQNWSAGVHFGGWSEAAHTDTFRAAPGDVVTSRVVLNHRNHTGDLAELGGQCTMLDTKYVTFSDARFVITTHDDMPVPEEKYDLQYYVGTSRYLDPDHADYDPNESKVCGNPEDSGSWVTDLPSDPNDVRAVRVLYKNSELPYRDGRYQLEVDHQIKDDVDAGQDIWMWSDFRRVAGNTAGEWAGAELDMAAVTRGDEPGGSRGGYSPSGYRYPAYGQHRDVIRAVVASPKLQKSTDRLTVMPNSVGSYTLDYRAEVPPSAGIETVDGFTITDTLPEGVTYVDGSASIAPDSVNTDSDGIQTITWVIDGVDVNTDYELTYDVEYGSDIEPGSVLENVAEADIGGLTSPRARATVGVADAGSTSIIKQSHDDLVGLQSGFTGEGGWTVSVISDSPVTQDVVDVIDVLPFDDDLRGTELAGDLALEGVNAPSGMQVYYTTHDPADLSDDPNHDGSTRADNGTLGNPSSIWSTTFTEDATAVRVIGGPLVPGGELSFDVNVSVEGAAPGDQLENRAQGRAEETRLVMRTSAPLAFDIGQISHEKTMTSAEPIGNGLWQVEYQITVENDEELSTWYTLTDELRFAPDITVTDAEITSAPSGVTTDASWDGENNLLVAEDVDIPANNDSAYEPHVYTVQVQAEVPMSFDLSGEDNPTECADPSGDPTDQGLTNTSTATDPMDEQSHDWACAELPSIEIAKDITQNPVPSGDGWVVEYEVVVTNSGAAEGTYDVFDQLRFGDSLEVTSHQVDGPTGVDLNSNWTGLGSSPEESENMIAQEVTIPAETTHTYVVEVAFTFDKETGDPADLVCPEEGSGQHGGVANTALTDHNDHQAEDEDCATVEIPGEVTWQKVDRSEQHLSGSEWVLIGPNDQEITVTDCVDSADDCSGADIDGREGFFHVNDLAWGEWVLQETKAPSGYMLDATEHEFTVGPEGITIDVGQKENRPVPELEIPLTGGWSEQAFLLFGALLLGGAGTAVGVKRRFTRI